MGNKQGQLYTVREEEPIYTSVKGCLKTCMILLAIFMGLMILRSWDDGWTHYGEERAFDKIAEDLEQVRIGVLFFEEKHGRYPENSREVLDLVNKNDLHYVKGLYEVITTPNYLEMVAITSESFKWNDGSYSGYGTGAEQKLSYRGVAITREGAILDNNYVHEFKAEVGNGGCE